jgi:hypothetical protein
MPQPPIFQYLAFSAGLLGVCFYPVVSIAQYASATGQTGFIQMPDGRIADEGVWRTGYSFNKPYTALWSSLSILPQLEVSGRYTRTMGISAFGASSTYGDLKDKSFDTKALLIKEGQFHPWMPAISAGIQDIFGTEIYRAEYISMSKKADVGIGTLDTSVGYGRKRIDGAFGGVRFTPDALPSISLVAEYDAFNYKQDTGAFLNGAAQRRKGINGALEYHPNRWLHLQAGMQHDQPAFNAYVSIPLQDKTFVPKIQEPAPFNEIPTRYSQEHWLRDTTQRSAIIRHLGQEDFRNITVDYDYHILRARLTNIRISDQTRAIGRAVRILQAYAPLETHEIHIQYTTPENLPVTEWRFTNLAKLQRYFNGMLPTDELQSSVERTVAHPKTWQSYTDHQAESQQAINEALDSAKTSAAVRVMDDGHPIGLRFNDNKLNQIRVYPAFSSYWNQGADNSPGILKYEFSLGAGLDRALAERTFLRANINWIFAENISSVSEKTKSNSLLPHVRSDITEYRRNDNVKLQRLLVNHFEHPAPENYARVSVGLYEEMFGGIGGQWLYAPSKYPFAVDVAVDWLKQRDYQGAFGMLPYSTTTALASLHYRVTPDVTARIRAGRFLAKDTGARFEMARHFKSGATVGFWYTQTNGNDITDPGSPGKPYHDKGFFISLPLSPLLTKDTQTIGNFSMSPWTRDVGQMVTSPADLYTVLERPYIRQLNGVPDLKTLGEFDE